MSRRSGISFIFPGQGTQVAGMGKALYDNFAVARRVIDMVDDALSMRLSDVMFFDRDNTLVHTANAQPAIMAVSIAILEVLKSESGLAIEDMCEVVAGHSLGQYTALCATDSIDLTTTAKLLRIRGNAMQNACQGVEHGMSALISPDMYANNVLNSTVAEVLAKARASYGVVDIANDNSTTQIVISGHAAAIDYVTQLLEGTTIKAIRLNVSAPFHSSLISNAEDEMRKAFEKVEFKQPIVPVIDNVTLQYLTESDAIEKSLITQICSTVRWRETTNILINQCHSIIEIGQSKVLTNMISKDLTKLGISNKITKCIGNIADITEYLQYKEKVS